MTRAPSSALTFKLTVRGVGVCQLPASMKRVAEYLSPFTSVIVLIVALFRGLLVAVSIGEPETNVTFFAPAISAWKCASATCGSRLYNGFVAAGL